jgi:nitrate reductase delta subunit
MEVGQRQQIYQAFSQLLNYPSSNLVEQAGNTIKLLEKDHTQAAEQIAIFLNIIEKIPLSRLEEMYTGTFDVNPACHIFAGHILFGESFKRNTFMAELAVEYEKRGFDTKKELVDHIPLLLRFLSEIDQEDETANELLVECLIPVFEKMNDNFKDDSTSPYMPVLRSTLIVLQELNQ